MKAKDIQEGGRYCAKVSGKSAIVRVDKIREATVGVRTPRLNTVYDVTNLNTGRKTTFRSAQRFHSAVQPKTVAEVNALQGQEQEADLGPATYGHKQSNLAESLRRRKDTSADTSPHVIVEARAGTGKTTTLVEGLKRVKGLPTSITPSPQQAAVWEAMEQSRGRAQSICFVAFNKSIAAELQARVPQGCDAMTMHSMGFKAVRRAFGQVNVEGDRVLNIISELLERDLRDLRRNKWDMLQAARKLIDLCKMNLADPNIRFQNGEETTIGVAWHEALSDLAAYYDVDLNGSQAEVFTLVPQVLERCKDVAADGQVDFADMIWLPVVLDLQVQKYDLLLVDEVQDLSRVQQALARKAGRRLICVGDSRQAIYGFAGADSESMDHLERELKDTDRGCIHLPLTVTRRCGKAIVQEARKYVPDFEAHEDNPIGVLKTAKIIGDLGPAAEEREGIPRVDCYQLLVADGDMVLCRVNAPLVSECFRFLKAGRKANIQGRDVGQGLISTIRRSKTDSVVQMTGWLSNWLDNETWKENAKRNPSEARLIALQDRHDCIVCFTEDQESVEGVVAKIESVFTDEKNGRGIMLSSIHKAKGLEASRVFILQPEGAQMPHPMARSKWQREQEYNLLYVAITRAIEELVYVS